MGGGDAADFRKADAGEAAARPFAPYHLGPGDRLRIITFGEDSLTGEFEISSAGNVALPLVGDIKAAGDTTSTFQTKVETALKDVYLKDPKVSVDVLNYRPFYILGEVGKPG